MSKLQLNAGAGWEDHTIEIGYGNRATMETHEIVYEAEGLALANLLRTSIPWRTMKYMMKALLMDEYQHGSKCKHEESLVESLHGAARYIQQDLHGTL